MTDTPSQKHVFMSYSRRDEAVMRRVAEFLRERGINVWVDNEKLVPGTPIWEVEIEKAIKNASAVVVILSPDSKNSEWVRREISLADEYHARIFPVLVRGDEEASISLRLITRQYVDIRKNEDIGMNSLRAALSSYLEELKSQEWNSGEEAERLAREKAQREATEKTTREREERETTDKANREKALKAGELHYKGMLAQKEGNYNEAEYLFRQSLEIAIQLNDEQGKANILHQLAILTQDQQAKEKAKREAVEKAAREKAEREAAEKDAREKAERKAAEKATREKAEREAAEKVAKEKNKQKAVLTYADLLNHVQNKLLARLRLDPSIDITDPDQVEHASQDILDQILAEEHIVLTRPERNRMAGQIKIWILGTQKINYLNLGRNLLSNEIVLFSDEEVVRSFNFKFSHKGKLVMTNLRLIFWDLVDQSYYFEIPISILRQAKFKWNILSALIIVLPTGQKFELAVAGKIHFDKLVQQIRVNL